MSKRINFGPFGYVFALMIMLFSISTLSALSFKAIEIGYESREEQTYFLSDQGKVVHRDDDSEEFQLFEVDKGWKRISKIPSSDEGDFDSPDYPILDITKSGIFLGMVDDDYPFVYYPDNTYVDLNQEISKLGKSVEGFYVKSLHINEDGMVVGIFDNYDDHPEDSYSHSVFIYTRKNGVKLLDNRLVQDYRLAEVKAVNNRGQILFQAEIDGIEEIEEIFYLYDFKTGFVNLGQFGLKEIVADLLGVTHNDGRPLTLTMNDNGVIAGWVGADYDDEDDMTIFVYNPETGTHIVPIKRDRYRKWPPILLTNDNQVIVSAGRKWYGGGNVDDIQKAFKWSENEGLTEIVNWGEFDSSLAIYDMAVSEGGRVQFVGVNFYEDGNEERIREGFIWDTVEGYQKLGDVIGDANKVYNMDQLGDGKLSINSRGEILVEEVDTFEEDGGNVVLLVPVSKG